MFSRFVKESIEKLCFTKVKAVQILDAESLWSPKMTLYFHIESRVIVGFGGGFLFVFWVFWFFFRYSSGLPMLD